MGAGFEAAAAALPPMQLSRLLQPTIAVLFATHRATRAAGSVKEANERWAAPPTSSAAAVNVLQPRA